MQRMDESQLRSAREGDSWESGGEDWPDAYRHSPMSSEEARAVSFVGQDLRPGKLLGWESMAAWDAEDWAPSRRGRLRDHLS